jgi:hypothetical protein
MKPLSLRAYAKRRNCSHVAVRNAIKAGRLVKSVVDVDGQPKIADPELADREWKANTDLSRAPDSVKRSAAAGHRQATAAAATEAVIQPVATVLEPQPHGGALQRNIILPADFDPEKETIEGASAREKHWRAKTAELKYRKRPPPRLALSEWADRHFYLSRNRRRSRAAGTRCRTSANRWTRSPIRASCRSRS